MANMTTQEILQGIKDWAAPKVIYDISAAHNNTKYADLSDALGTNGGNIPQEYRKGGITVRFVRTYDNKYIQYRLMDDGWSINTDDWSFCGDDVLVENPEWIRVLLDSHKRILAGLKSDGSVEWAIGVPTPVKTYIDNAIAEIKNGTEGTDLDGLNKIIAFLSEFSTSDTLKDLLDEKVDKEEGKSLIDAEYANGVHYIENPEFGEVKVDNENRILEAIMKDGIKLLPAGVKVIGTAEYDGATVKTVENPEFAGVWLDGGDKILFGIQTDGNFLFGCGVPKQVKEYIEQKIEELSLDEYESIVAFIGDYLNNTTLEELLSKKVDGEYVDNPEYIEAKTDAEDKVIEATKNDGTKFFAHGVEVHGKQDIDGVTYYVISNPEWIVAWVDESHRILMGIRVNGSTYIASSDLIDAINSIKEKLKYAKFDDIDWDALLQVMLYDNVEYMSVETDSYSKVLGGRKNNGRRFENVGLDTPNMSIDGTNIETFEDPEGRMSLSKDGKNKVISYRDKTGKLHENAGLETPVIETDSLIISENGITGLKKDLGIDSKIKKYNLPKYGVCNIKQETFYVSYNENIQTASDVYVIQDLEDSAENAHAKLTIAFYYLKSSLIDNGDGTYSKHNDGVEGHDVKLNFYAASKVTAVNGIPYVTSTLTEVVDPETGDVTYEVNENSVRVVQIVDTPDVRTWPVDKKTEHYCLVDINFGDYLTATNIAIGVKFQGSSTLEYRKRNFRFTFYKNTSYSKKQKIKIGEMVRCSGYNLKANFTNSERIKENVMNIIFMDIWDKRDIINRYPWDIKVNPYTGATGMIKGFPIRLNIGGSFYGVYIYGLKKDKANYCLDNDSDGMIVGSTLNTDDCWTAAKWQDYEDEMNDEMSESNKGALTTFFDFINERLYNGSDDNIYDITQLTDVDGTMYVTSTLEGGIPVASSVSATLIPFDRDTMPERMSIIDWIDYIICLQVFYMVDNNCRNMMLYTGADKKKFYPFFYDLDLSWNFGTNYSVDIMIPYGEPGGSNAGDKSIWEHFKAAYWDEIRNRYFELRNSVLNTEYITEVCNSVADYIPDSDKLSERERWGSGSFDMSGKITIMANRLLWLDSYYNKD